MFTRSRSFIVLLLACVLQTQTAAAGHVRRLEGVVNLNTATPDELALLPGIGPAKIRNVIAYRRAHPFRTVDELVRIKGIGRKMVKRLRLHLAVSGPTTAQQVIRPAATAEVIVPGPPPPLLAAPDLPRRDGAIRPPLASPPIRPAGPPRGSVPAKPAVAPRRLLPKAVFPAGFGKHCPRPP